MTLNPPSQYADDRNLSARQRLWQQRQPPFDLAGWVLDLVEVRAGMRVLDVGCGNGLYLDALRSRGITGVGCDLSLGMLRTAGPGTTLVNGDATAVPFASGRFDVVLAPHMLYHVADRERAVRELRRVLAVGGVCVAVTNGPDHMRALRRLVEQAVRRSTPGWEMRNPATHEFSLANGAAQLRAGFATVDCVRPPDAGAVSIIDPAIVADYVASIADHYETETSRPWDAVVAEVRTAVERAIDADGRFVVRADTGAFVCR